MQDKESRASRVKWFEHDRFGMFIHWGLYAIPAKGEWIRCQERISNEEYQVYFDEFDPAGCDMRRWARLAAEAGMKYAVMTAKHHDGFCLFDSALTEYKSTRTKSGRDFVREYVDAFRAEGLKVGLYYSLVDWHHEDYPHYGDRYHPMRDSESHGNEGRDFERYLDYMHGQVRELCENYGKLDILWFDFSYDELYGEKWRAAELVKTARRLQPGIIIDNRLEGSGEGFGSLLSGEPSECSGDFVCPEQFIPPRGVVDANGEPVTWEACFTMNNHWGYSAWDKAYKSPELLIKKLVECVSKGGNMLLNVGPDARGHIPGEAVRVLREIGRWMQQNGESIYGCGYSGYDKPEFGRITRRGDVLYLHVYESSIGPLPLSFIKASELDSIRLLATGAELKPAKGWASGHYPDTVFIDVAGADCELPDRTDTVIELRLRR